MNDDKRTSFFDHVFSVGTPECTIFSAVVALAVALLLLLTGFWNTVWIALITCVGAVLGGVRNKKQMFKNFINRLIPDKKTVPYREEHPEIARAVREAREAREKAEAPAPEKEKDEDGKE